MKLHYARFLYPDRIVRSDRETLEQFTFTVRLRWRTIPCEKSMDPSGPQSDCPVLWTVTGSHGLNGCLVSSLKKRRRSIFPPLYGVIWSIHLTLKTKITINHFETLASLSQSLSTSSSLSQSLSRLYLSPSLPSQLNPNRSSLSQSLSASPSRSSLPLSLVLITAHSLPRRCHHHHHLVLYYL